MSHENPETAKIFLNLEDAPESNAMSADTDGYEHDQPSAPLRPQAMNTSSSSVASGPALVALIAILGGGSIFGMRVVSKHAAIAAENFVLDYQESAVGSDFDTRFEATMLNLERSTRPVQVPMAYLQRDPFNFSGGEVIQPVQVAAEDPMDAAERERRRAEALAAALVAQRERENQAAMSKALGGYQLQSTLQGSNPVARISGEIVRVGGTLSYEITRGKDDKPDTGTFTVEGIGGRTVVLVAPDASRYELAIGMPFRELEAPVREAPAEAPAPVDEFAAGVEAQTPTETPAQTAPATENADGTTEGGASETGDDTAEKPASESEAAEGDGAEPTFMERLKAASEALKQNEADESAEDEEAQAAETESDTGAEAEVTDEVTNKDQSAEAESADAGIDEAEADTEAETETEADPGSEEEADESEDDSADGSADETSDETDDGSDEGSDEGSDDEGGR